MSGSFGDFDFGISGFGDAGMASPEVYFAANGIGVFAVGISPIGTRPPLNLINTIASQYANSPTIDQLIWNNLAYLECAGEIDGWYDNIWNILTAQSYGLDVWGRIVGVIRVLEVANTSFFGYEEALPGSQPYGQAPFYTGQQINSNFALSDDSFRTLILAKAMANICDGSVASINQILLNLFPGRGNCYVTDGHNMTMTYTFEFPISPVELAIVQQSGVLPTPCGVAAAVVVN